VTLKQIVAVVVLSLTLGGWAFYGMALWTRHNFQHAVAAQDHEMLVRVVQYLQQQEAAAQKGK
jgi:hypothetical protein